MSCLSKKNELSFQENELFFQKYSVMDGVMDSPDFKAIHHTYFVLYILVIECII